MLRPWEGVREITHRDMVATAVEEDIRQETVEDMGEEVTVTMDRIVHLMEETVVDIPIGTMALEEDHHDLVVVVVILMIEMVEIAVAETATTVSIADGKMMALAIPSM